ncbi:MAG: hypothetical protein ABIN74_10645 [Ferruginibacter sp.]
MKMKIAALLFFVSVALTTNAQSQHNEFVQKGEFGITVGVAHYFGDLNTRAAVNRPKPAIGAFSVKHLAIMWEYV